MSLRHCCVALLLLSAPLAHSAAQEEPADDERLAPSLLIRNGLGALLPVGERGALSLTLSLTGSVSALSGTMESAPRSWVNLGVATGYMRLRPVDNRLRTFTFARLSYNLERYAPAPNNPAHTGGVAVGLGGLAQVTPRFGVIADAGLTWSVRRQFSRTIPPFGFPSMSSTSTSSQWGIGTSIGVTLRAKPKSNP